jgi:hypothetical protein
MPATALSVFTTPLKETITNQLVSAPIDWDEDEETVTVYCQGERVVFGIDDLTSVDGYPVVM